MLAKSHDGRKNSTLTVFSHTDEANDDRSRSPPIGNIQNGGHYASAYFFKPKNAARFLSISIISMVISAKCRHTR